MKINQSLSILRYLYLFLKTGGNPHIQCFSSQITFKNRRERGIRCPHSPTLLPPPFRRPSSVKRITMVAPHLLQLWAAGFWYSGTPSFRRLRKLFFNCLSPCHLLQRFSGNLHPSPTRQILLQSCIQPHFQDNMSKKSWIERAKYHHDRGIARQLQVPRDEDIERPHPSHGGSRGYPPSERNLMLDVFKDNPPENLLSSLRWWQERP